MNNADSGAQLAALDQRVTGIEQGLQSVADAVSSLGSKIDARSQTNWGPIWSALGTMTAVLGLIGATVYAPIKETQLRMERDIVTLDQHQREGDNALKAELVPRREHELFWKTYERSLERIVTRIDRLEYGPASRRIDR